jgi:quercetin dioxygenase-like cupin family protein
MSEASFFSWDQMKEVSTVPRIWRRAVSVDNVMLVRFRLEKGANVEIHQHPHEQIIYLLSGAIDFESGGDRRILRSGDVVCLPSNVPHGGVAVEESITLEIFYPLRPDLVSE